MKYEVYDVNFGDAVHTVNSYSKAAEIARDMNEGKLEPMYAVREADDPLDDFNYVGSRHHY